MFARPQRGNGHRLVQKWRRRDIHCFNFRISQHLAVVGVDLGAARRCGQFIGGLRVHVRDSHHF
jgi:hypothetical protein